MQLYAITERKLLPGDEAERLVALSFLAAKWARAGVDWIQVREKDMTAEELRELTRVVVAAVRGEGTKTRVLLNGPAEIALDAGADGVHLPGNTADSAMQEVRAAFARAAREAVVSRACHSVEEALAARDASMIVFAPVFEKVAASGVSPGQGLAALAACCRAAGPVPVFALGGVTRESAAGCLDAGAAGVAGIRLFLGDDWQRLRSR